VKPHEQTQQAWRIPLTVLAFLLPLAFAAFTQHAWEDYFITLRSSRNLVEGHGLVFNPGERVHTFTSPLGVLVPALCTWIVGPGREEFALWLFRVINAAFLASTTWLIWSRVEKLKVGVVGRVVLFGLLLSDAKLTDFSINGMETALLVFFAVLLWSELESSTALNVKRLGLAIGGLMWTRPDAFLLIGALLLPHLLIRRSTAGAREQLPPLFRSLVLGGALYLPWFAWAFWYYGTPVPHTIIAKSAYTVAPQLSDLALLPIRTLMGQSMALDLFLPAYWTFGGWPNVLRYSAHLLTGVVAFGWLSPGLPPAARRVSLSLFLGLFYLCSIILFPWYLPPWSALAYIAFALAVDHVYASTKARHSATWTAAIRLGCLLVVGLQFAMFLAVAWQMRIQQHVVENGARRALGEWLRAHSQPGDTLFLEPLGYIGYYSNLKTFDFPGLSSPEVVAAVRRGARRYVDLIEELAPTWVVLRPTEAQRGEFQKKPVLQSYELVQAWDTLPQLEAVRFLPGRAWTEFESRYLLFRRKPVSGLPETPR
jgi:hypothetical protein